MPEQLCPGCNFWIRYTLPKDQYRGKCMNGDRKKEVYPERTYGFTLVTKETDTCSHWIPKT